MPLAAFAILVMLKFESSVLVAIAVAGSWIVV
jgi:hypothetical protein